MQIILLPFFAVLALLAISVSVNYHQHPKRDAPIVTQDDHDMSDMDVYSNTETGYLRLPKSLRPSYYKLQLTPHLDEASGWKLEGRVAIIFTCIQPTNQIVLHSLNITIGATSIVALNERMVSEDNDTIPILEATSEETRHFYIITLGTTLQAGVEYQISMDYETEISGDLDGFYKSSYLDQASNTTKCGKIIFKRPPIVVK